jgi:hypothetical protein
VYIGGIVRMAQGGRLANASLPYGIGAIMGIMTSVYVVGEPKRLSGLKAKMEQRGLASEILLLPCLPLSVLNGILFHVVYERLRPVLPARAVRTSSLVIQAAIFCTLVGVGGPVFLKCCTGGGESRK